MWAFSGVGSGQYYSAFSEAGTAGVKIVFVHGLEAALELVGGPGEPSEVAVCIKEHLDVCEQHSERVFAQLGTHASG